MFNFINFVTMNKIKFDFNLNTYSSYQMTGLKVFNKHCLSNKFLLFLLPYYYFDELLQNFPEISFQTQVLRISIYK